jgi:hypothetical protein
VRCPAGPSQAARRIYERIARAASGFHEDRGRGLRTARSANNQQGAQAAGVPGWLGNLAERVLRACHIESEGHSGAAGRRLELNTLANGRSAGLMFAVFFAVRALHRASISVPGG